jgi:ribonuclease BN (tRNA processing enzyme)
VGGNTPSILLDSGDGDLIVLDAGTGLRPLGLDLVQRLPDGRRLLLLLSHTHWDHIQGLPFFAPLRLPGYQVTVLGERRTCCGLEKVLSGQMEAEYLPFALKDLAAKVTIHEIEDGRTWISGKHTTVLARRLSHPGSVLGYRISSGGKSVVYVTDVSHPLTGLDPSVVALARGADLLIHDSHFTPAEQSLHPDWGHSSWLNAVQVGREAGVRNLALFHHAPERSDDEVEQIERGAQAILPVAFAAREGMEVVV